MRQLGRVTPFTYDHRSSDTDPALWAADAVCWAVGAGGHWRRRIDPVLTRRAHLPITRDTRRLLVRGTNRVHFSPLLRRAPTVSLAEQILTTTFVGTTTSPGRTSLASSRSLV